MLSEVYKHFIMGKSDLYLKLKVAMSK